MLFNGRGLTRIWHVCGSGSFDLTDSYDQRWRACCVGGARLATSFRLILGVIVSAQNDSVCRFGVFELDLRAAELRKNGVKLRLQEQPYQILLKLIEHHGEVVSREEPRPGDLRARAERPLKILKLKKR